jgi:hypothetical protein
MKDEIVPPEQMVTLLNKAHSSKFVDKVDKILKNY